MSLVRTASLTLATFALTSGWALAQPDRPLGDVARAEIKACLNNKRWDFDARHLPTMVDQAPGLPNGMRIARTPTASGKLVVYEDAGGSLIECGVVIYSTPPAGLSPDVGEMVRQTQPTYHAMTAGAWRLSGGEGDTEQYWGAPHAAGLYGVLMRVAPPDSVDAGPKLQVDNHSILVH